MNSRDLFSLCLRNLWRRKLRTSLTVLGVLIGTTSIIVMISLGLGMERSQMQMIESMGSLTTIKVQSGSSMSMSYGPGGREAKTGSKTAHLNDAAVDDFKKFAHVTAVGPVVRGEFYGLMVGKYNCYLQVMGVKEDYFKNFDIKLTTGEFPSHSVKSKPFILLPQNISDMLNDESAMRRGQYQPIHLDDPMQARVRLDYMGYDPQSGRSKVEKTFPLRPVGLFQSSGWEHNAYMLVKDVDLLNKEFKRLQQAQGGMEQNGGGAAPTSKDKYSEIQVKVDDIKNVLDVKAKLEALGYMTFSMMDWVQEMNKGMAVVQAVLAGIGSVALLVAAIGITNTMVMSIYERTREIGVMKVIGASVGNIRKIFLTEAIMIGVIGGALGVGLSLGLSALINAIVGPAMAASSGIMATQNIQITVIPLWLITLGVIFSGFIGLLSGYYPAKRATRLSAIEAIKTE